jgi:hypothetical protein
MQWKREVGRVMKQKNLTPEDTINWQLWWKGPINKMTERRIRLGVLPPTPRSNLYGFKSRWDRNVKASLTIQTES